MSKPHTIVVHGVSSADEVPRLHELADRAEIRVAPDGGALAAQLPGADVLLGWKFSAKDLRAAWPQAQQLRWIHWCGAGVDAALFPELAQSNVALTNVRGIFDRAMAEYTLGLVLSFAKELPRTLRSQQQHLWDYRLVDMMQGRTALVVGVGSIGKSIGKLLTANDMHVVGVGRSRRDGGEHFSEIHAIDKLNELLPLADYVVLITPLTDATRGLFGQQQFALMRNTAHFINLGRGALVDEAALIVALKAQTIAGAALDVFEQEPLQPHSPLWDMANVIVSPHMSGDYIGYHSAMADLFIDNFARYANSHTLMNLVDKQLGFVASE
jgi:phosphoglycerate dehydrogenase-like enzyme